MTTAHMDTDKYRPPDDWINVHSLYICRERMNLNPSQVEDLTGISANQILNWENAIGVPALEDLETLAKHYRCPVGYFFKDKPLPLYMGEVNFRGLSKDKIDSLSYTSRLKIDEFLVLANTLSNIVKELDIPNNPDIPKESSNTNIKEIVRKERIALGFSNEIRKQWNTPNDAFNFWKNAIETRGVYIISLGLIINEVRGASKWDNDSPPVILVNKNDRESATGRTFTLLHEWAHLILREPGIVCDYVGFEEKAQIERFSNQFAAEMMVSKDELREYLENNGLYRYKPRWGDNDIDKIKYNFKVSRDVIAISLEDLNLAPNGFYMTKRNQWDRKKPFFGGQRKLSSGRPTKIRSRYQELGTPFSKLISDAYMNSSISITNLSRILGMKIDKLPDFVDYVKSSG